MSGKKINDHKFWAGGAHEGSPFPKGVHVKKESGSTGAGGLSHYEDTTETIHSQQQAGMKKIHGHPHKVGHRN